MDEDNIADEAIGNARRDQAVIKLLTHLLHDVYVPTYGVDPNTVGQLLPTVFVDWLFTQAGTLDHVAHCEAAGVEYPTWEFVQALMADPTAVQRIGAAWYGIVLARRPAPKKQLETISLAMLLTYADGRITPVTVNIECSEHNRGIVTDGELAAQVATYYRVFLEAVVEDGVDGLHAKGGDYGGEEPFNVMMGLLLRSVQSLPVSQQEGVMRYVRLAQGLIRRPRKKQPPPPHIIVPSSPGGARGGFDA